MWWNLSVDVYLMLEKKKKGFTLVSLIDHKTRFYLWILDTRKFKNKSRKDGHFHFWETIHVTSSSCNATRRKLISRPRVSLEGFLANVYHLFFFSPSSFVSFYSDLSYFLSSLSDKIKSSPFHNIQISITMNRLSLATFRNVRNSSGLWRIWKETEGDLEYPSN
jgi:hypothetical protein